MADYKHVVRLPYTTGVPEDVSVNVFHTNSSTDGLAVGFSSALVTFYNAIDVYFGNLLSQATNAATITTYRLADPEPRVPFNVTQFTLTTGTGAIAPPEVAICLSFQGDPISGVPQARRRGRVYLGPLNQGAIGTDGRPLSAAITAIAGAADTLLGGSLAGTYGVWSVYSPTYNEMTTVKNGWVDNELDTVRSRGRRANSRFTFS